ncbi:MAG: tetratricopeptide repeat protein [Clostridiaceae bacterium]|nr:tetratricopeptide repeat protein [Clostridiaceae bacterium]
MIITVFFVRTPGFLIAFWCVLGVGALIAIANFVQIMRYNKRSSSGNYPNYEKRYDEAISKAKGGDFAGALEILNECVKRMPYYDACAIANIILCRDVLSGKLSETAGRFAAAGDWENTVASAPDYWIGYYNLGCDAGKVGNSEEALRYLKTAQECAPANSFVLTALGTWTAIFERDIVLAHKYFKQAVDSDPDNKIARKYLRKSTSDLNQR